MTKKKIYVICLGNLVHIFVESEEKAFQVFKTLTEDDCLRLRSNVMSDDYKESFSYPDEINISLKAETLDLFENEEEAKRARDNYDKAQKMKLIVKKKP